MIPLKETFQIDEEFINEQRPARTRQNGLLLKYTPPADAYSLKKMQRFITEFVSNSIDYNTEPGETPVFGFEIHYSDDNIKYVLYTSDESLKRPLVNRLDVDFGGGISELEPRSPSSGNWFVPIKEGDYAATAEMHLKHHFYEPLNNHQTNHSSTDGFKSPYPNVFQQMVDERDTREVIQILFKPYGYNWTNSSLRSLEGRAETVKKRKQGSRSRFLDIDSLSVNKSEDVELSSTARNSISNIKSQRDRPGYFVNIRFAAISAQEDVAREQLQHMTAEFRQKYRDPGTGQTLVPVLKKGADIEDLLLDMINRNPRYMNWPSLSRSLYRRFRRNNCETTLITPEELVSLAHFISKDRDITNTIKWATSGYSEQLPPEYGKHYEEYYATGSARLRPWEETNEGEKEDDSTSEAESEDSNEEIFLDDDIENQFQ